MQAHLAVPGWIVMFVAIGAIAVLVRLASSSKAGLVLFLAGGVGLVLLTYSARQVRIAPPAVVSEMHAPATAFVADVPMPSIPSNKPVRPKRPPRAKPPQRAEDPPIPSTPSRTPAVATAETPPAPPVAEIGITSSVAEGSAPVTPEASTTLYQGSSATGRLIETLPEWVTSLADARTGSNSLSLSSGRFATIEAAEKELWQKARDFVARDLRQRIPAAVHWSPSVETLKSSGFIVERCVERTTIEVGEFVEPMFRVHWKGTLSTDVRAAVADAWRPTIQQDRLEKVAFGFLGVTGFFAFLNLILRSAAARLAARKAPAA